MNQSEAKLQADIVKTFRKHPGVEKLFSIPNEGAGGNRIRGAQLVATGLLSGVSDLECWLTNGWTLYPEVKDHNKWKQSDRQKKFEKDVKESSGKRLYRLIFSVEDMKEFINYGLSIEP